MPRRWVNEGRQKHIVPEEPVRPFVGRGWRSRLGISTTAPKEFIFIHSMQYVITKSPHETSAEAMSSSQGNRAQAVEKHPACRNDTHVRAILAWDLLSLLSQLGQRRHTPNLHLPDPHAVAARTNPQEARRSAVLELVLEQCHSTSLTFWAPSSSQTASEPTAPRLHP